MVGLFLCNVHCSNERIYPFHNLSQSVLFQKGLEDEQQLTLNELLDDDSLQTENNYVQVSGTVAQSPETMMKDKSI